MYRLPSEALCGAAYDVRVRRHTCRKIIAEVIGATQPKISATILRLTEGDIVTLVQGLLRLAAASHLFILVDPAPAISFKLTSCVSCAELSVT